MFSLGDSRSISVFINIGKSIQVVDDVREWVVLFVQVMHGT